MSFVALGGDGSTRPTFFELVAAERLMPSLKAATIYSLSIFAQRRPMFHRLLDWEDEVFALITALLDRQSLQNGSSSFAESLYGLRRAGRPTSQGLPDPALLHRGQQHTLAVLVLLPYLKSKLDRLYSVHRRVDGVLGLTFARAQTESARHEAAGGSTLQAQLQRLKATTLNCFLRVYPWVHASQEALRFGYQLLYLLDSTPYFSPVLHLLQQHVVRVSGHEMVEVQRRKQRQRQQQLQGALQSGPWLVRVLRQGWLHSSYALADHTRNALILSVFAFKLLEWWYLSAESKLGGTKAPPIPPPPPAPRPAIDGVPLPEDRSVCALCRKKRTNPAMAACSGYVFCYPCIFPFVDQHGCCPVTRLPCTLEQVRKLYQSA